MNHGEKAVEFFCGGYNCAQSTAAAFAEEAGIGAESITAMMAGFGGGIGGTREMCGAVSAMVWALGLSGGKYDPSDNEAKTALYQSVREAIHEFTEKFGTTNCRELLQKAGCLPKPDPSVRNAEYYAKRPCAHFVEAAAEIAARRGV
jgi:C_GCAxxG_C_C family probable redox protein